MSGKLSKSERTRQRILDASAMILARDGYARAKLSDIANEASTHAGAIYYYFSSKEELVEEVMRSASGRFVSTLESSLAQCPADTSPIDSLAVAIRTGIAVILSEDAYTSAHARVYGELPTEMRGRLAPDTDAYHEIWRKLIASARASGAIRKELDVKLVRLLLLGSITWAREWYKKGSGRSIEAIEEHAIALFLGGLLPEKTRNSPQRSVEKRAGRARLARAE